MHIHLNQIFSLDDTNYITWRELTKGAHEKPINRFKGIPYFKEARGIIPAINFHSNPFKEDQEDSPWRDSIFQNEGRVIYNGDNKSHLIPAHEIRGNKIVLAQLKYYHSKNEAERSKAPPIIVTRTVKINGKTGYREFIGFGLISTPPELIYQYEKNSNKVFANYRFEVILLKLDNTDTFSWNWIDDRRDKNITIANSNNNAPRSWKEWILQGPKSLSKNRLKIRSYRIISESEQKDMPEKNRKIISDLLKIHYPNPKVDGIRFEALASFLATLYFDNENYMRGWITVGTADRGVDFVGRLDIGNDSFSQTSIIVLGQSKRYKHSISGEKLTRVASRMTRGYIGMVITLGTITKQAQEEIKDDKLPIILLNGKKVSELLLDYMNKTGRTLESIIEEQDEWAFDNIGTEHYDTILNMI